jgi:hypothetical protein
MVIQRFKIQRFKDSRFRISRLAFGCWLLAIGSINQGLSLLHFMKLPKAKSQRPEAVNVKSHYFYVYV